MTQSNSSLLILCPLFNFQITKNFVGEHTPIEEKLFSKNFEAELRQGYKITNQLLLRKIDPDELECYISSNLYKMEGQIGALISDKSFVFEVSSHQWKNASDLVYEALLALRLLKKGGVFCKVIWGAENSRICSLSIMNPSIPWLPQQYLLDVDEIDNFRHLLKKIKKLDLDSNKTFRIACERFSRSYEERRDDDTIIDFIIAFESLFFEGNKAPSSVAGQFIGLGCSMLLGKNNTDRKEIAQFFTKAYEIRNKIVHGSELPKPIKIADKEYTLYDLASKLQDYLRSSILELMD